MQITGNQRFKFLIIHYCPSDVKVTNRKSEQSTKKLTFRSVLWRRRIERYSISALTQQHRYTYTFFQRLSIFLDIWNENKAHEKRGTNLSHLQTLLVGSSLFVTVSSICVGNEAKNIQEANWNSSVGTFLKLKNWVYTPNSHNTPHKTLNPFSQSFLKIKFPTTIPDQNCQWNLLT